METIMKYALEALKNDIKKLVEYQKVYKNQRRTKRLVGERTMEPWEAAMNHEINRENLRIMYAAYGLMKGKTFSQIENNKNVEEEHPLVKFQYKIDEKLLLYKRLIVYKEVTEVE
jgi:hypothetical protein